MDRGFADFVYLFIDSNSFGMPFSVKVSSITDIYFLYLPYIYIIGFEIHISAQSQEIKNFKSDMLLVNRSTVQQFKCNKNLDLSQNVYFKENFKQSLDGAFVVFMW